jgi:hypothetical protein
MCEIIFLYSTNDVIHLSKGHRHFILLCYTVTIQSGDSNASELIIKFSVNKFLFQKINGLHDHYVRQLYKPLRTQESHALAHKVQPYNVRFPKFHGAILAGATTWIFLQCVHQQKPCAIFARLSCESLCMVRYL